MKAIALTRTHLAMLRLARVRIRHWDAARTLPMDNVLRARMQSLLAGTPYRDGSTNPGPLTLAQAQDVQRWANPRI